MHYRYAAPWTRARARVSYRREIPWKFRNRPRLVHLTTTFSFIHPKSFLFVAFTFMSRILYWRGSELIQVICFIAVTFFFFWFRLAHLGSMLNYFKMLIKQRNEFIKFWNVCLMFMSLSEIKLIRFTLLELSYFIIQVYNYYPISQKTNKVFSFSLWQADSGYK